MIQLCILSFIDIWFSETKLYESVNNPCFSTRSKLSGSKFRYTIINTIERTRKIIGVNDTVVVLLFLFKYDSKKRTQIMVNAIIITMNKMVENFIYSCMIIRKLIITRFLSFNIVVQYNSDTMDFWCLFCSLTTQLECIAATFIWIVYQLDVAGVFFTQSTYFYQVYDDNRWWTSWYQTLRKGGTTSWKFL